MGPRKVDWKPQSPSIILLWYNQVETHLPKYLIGINLFFLSDLLNKDWMLWRPWKCATHMACWQAINWLTLTDAPNCSPFGSTTLFPQGHASCGLLPANDRTWWGSLRSPLLWDARLLWWVTLASGQSYSLLQAELCPPKLMSKS